MREQRIALKHGADVALIGPALVHAHALQQDVAFGRLVESGHQPGSEIRAPLPAALKLISKEKILAALETGTMKAQGSVLTGAERLALASHLSGGASVEPQQPAGVCPASKFSIPLGEAAWTGW